ncbi:MAG: rod shape-determining protein MreD [Acidimicrobiales bacterium]
MRSWARFALLLLTAAVLQRGLLSQLRVADVSVDSFLLLAVAAGITGGGDRGAVVGFFSGLVLDLLVQTPLGLSALVYCLVGFAAGRLHGTVVRSNRALPALLAAVVSIAGVGLYAVIGELVGQVGAVTGHLPTIMAVVGVANLVLYPVVRPVVTWAWGDEPGLRPARR